MTCQTIGAHIAMPAGESCGIAEWLSCDDCGFYGLGDPHTACACGIAPNLDPAEFHAR